MEGGGESDGGRGESDGGREGEHWCSLTWAHHCPCPIMGAGCHSHAVVLWAAIIVGGHLFLFLAFRFHWWAFAFVGGCSLLLVGDHFHWWAFICTGGGSSSFIVVGWLSSLLEWCGGKPLVAGSCMVGFVGGCL